jgi:uncharacterized membrane protein YtjA (UPF0391 family)
MDACIRFGRNTSYKNVLIAAPAKISWIASGASQPESLGGSMLGWVATFFIIALIAGLFGFFGIAAAAGGIAKILFFIFLILFVVSLVGGLVRRA